MRTPVLNLARPAIHALCRVYFRLELRGTEHVPAAGPVIITPNHQTYADPPLVSIPVRRPVHYMAWNRLFDVPGLAWAIRRLRAFPVDVEGPGDHRAARQVVRLLGAGEAIMIFPEGGRTLDGRVQPFKPGAFRLAVSVKAPILPVTIDGGTAAWPPGRPLPRPGRIRITYHPLAHPEPSLGPREAARALAEHTWRTISGALPGMR